jgi:uncharacterized protein YkwD
MTRFLAALVSALALCALATVPASAAGLDKLIAPASVCPHQAEPSLPLVLQERTMRCMTNFARGQSSLARIAPSTALDKAADHKSGDLIRCGEFSHEACGRAFTFWMAHYGYLAGSCWGAAENIAWGTGRIGSVGAIFRAWLRSPGHRENILGPYTDIGIGLRLGVIEGHPAAHVWVQEFGSHSC